MKHSKTYIHSFCFQRTLLRFHFRSLISCPFGFGFGYDNNENTPRQSLNIEDQNPSITFNYDLTVPVTSRGNYKSSIEIQNFIEFEDELPLSIDKKFAFPEIIENNNSKQVDYKLFQKSEIQLECFGDGRFNLEFDVKKYLSNDSNLSENETKMYRVLLNSKTKIFGKYERNQSIERYREKKLKRKMTYQIRYKVRQDLAVKRLRNKGKFVKSKKMDIRSAVNFIMKQEQENLKNIDLQNKKNN